MQAPSSSQRSMQRRSPGAEPGPPPNVPVRSISPGISGGAGGSSAMQPRMSSASGRSSGSTERSSSSRRRTDNTATNSTAVPLSQIEKSVTHLLVATKQLLETLTQWSRGQATDTQVSDVYVRLGYEFNMACRAFTSINVDTSDLGNVPEELRHILESTLSQEASVEGLEKYLPKIRDIIVNLLHGLKRKQQRLRQRQSKDKEAGLTSDTGSVRANSNGQAGGAGASVTTSDASDVTHRPSMSRQTDGSMRSNISPTRQPLPRDPSLGGSDHSSLSSGTLQSMPVLPPYPANETIPTVNLPPDEDMSSFPPPPPPPKSVNSSALAALQSKGDLERRASRRYSAYQISKHLGSGANGVPMLPTQTTPLPNRTPGEARESMRAVTTREPFDSRDRHRRDDSSIPRGVKPETSPTRQPRKPAEEKEVVVPSQTSRNASVPTTPEDKYPKPSATLRGPLGGDDFPVVVANAADKDSSLANRSPVAAEVKPALPRPQVNGSTFLAEPSPAAVPAALTLFLQYKSKVKKAVFPGGRDELTVAKLQLAFIDKFSWSIQNNGADLPEIYIQDPVSGVRHELEDLADVQDRTVLVLNVEQLDEVKKHFDEGIGSIKKVIDAVKQNVDEQAAALHLVSERQQEAAKEMARLATTPATPPTEASRSSTVNSQRKLKPAQASEIQSLRRDLAVLRQTYTNFQTEIEGSMTTIRAKADNVKTAAASAVIPDVKSGQGQSLVTAGREKLNDESDRIVARVDDIQDIVEDLRKDVVQRGVRPRPQVLETLAKDIQEATKELRSMNDYMKREKPVWTKIWEQELQEICVGQEELKVMEDLALDLQHDLDKASATFSLVEQAMKEQAKDINAGVTNPALSRQFSRGLTKIAENSSVADPNTAKEGVLGEVRALQPNHEDRLEAIERAEKLRQKELASRPENPMKRELSRFVEEGRLKKSGGFEEVERRRILKDEQARKANWDRANGMLGMEGEGEEGEGDEDELDGQEGLEELEDELEGELGEMRDTAEHS